jgi:hypothetical protein
MGILFSFLLILSHVQMTMADECENYAWGEPYASSKFINDAMKYYSICSRDNFAYVCFRDGDPVFSAPKFACLELNSNFYGPVVTRSLISLPYSSNCTVLLGDYALMAMGARGIGVVDISNPDLMPGLSLIPTGDVCRSLAVQGPDQVVSAEWSALRIYDLADPTDPRELGAVTLNQARTVAIGGDFAFLACGNLGLAIVDISNPTVPSFVTQFPVGGFVDQVAVEGSRVYLTGYLIGMVTVDVAAPSSPSVVHILPLEGEPEALLTQGGYAYVTVGEAFTMTPGLPDFDALALVRLNQTATPSLVDYYFTSMDYSASALAPAGIILGEYEPSADLLLAPLQCPDLSDVPDSPTTGLSLSAPWPNPFNPLVHIRFNLTANESGLLRVHDLRGNLVAEIWRGTGTGDEMTATWNGTDTTGRACPSGTYGFILSHPDGGSSTRVTGTLLR